VSEVLGHINHISASDHGKSRHVVIGIEQILSVMRRTNKAPVQLWCTRSDTNVFSLRAERATQQLGNNAWGRRCSYVTGDFFTSVPQGADAYLLCGVIHDWDDNRAITILGNCRRAMTKNSRLLVVDMLVPHTNVNCFSKLLDLNMLVMTGGRERTETEFRTLLDVSGCKLTKIVPTMAQQSVIEAVPN